MNTPPNDTGTPGQIDPDKLSRPGVRYIPGQGPYRGPVRPGVSLSPQQPDSGTTPGSLHTQAGRDQLETKIESWSDRNPFKAILAKRLTKLGGPHAPSTVANDRHVMAEEPAVVLMRALPAAKAEQATPF